MASSCRASRSDARNRAEDSSFWDSKRTPGVKYINKGMMIAVMRADEHLPFAANAVWNYRRVISFVMAN